MQVRVLQEAAIEGRHEQDRRATRLLEQLQIELGNEVAQQVAAPAVHQALQAQRQAGHVAEGEPCEHRTGGSQAVRGVGILRPGEIVMLEVAEQGAVAHRNRLQGS